ncbi:MAG TPA: calcium-binding protein [Tepidisphaeraceae bacterium]|jgi:Ca2+-binding RTX toxin-like protein|nr:calcium-binding protein [Tepidisphaeraceae bacterium]
MKPVHGALHHACDEVVRRNISFAHRQFHEPLEPRRLLSASFASLNAQGTLSIIGTAKNNSILVQLAGTKVQAIVDGKTLSFAKSSVKRIWADGFGGNDRLTNQTSLPSTLIGSGGNDTLVGGSENDSMDGGPGQDVLRPRDGNNSGNIDPGSDTLDYQGATPGEFWLSTSPYGGIPPLSLGIIHGSSAQWTDWFDVVTTATPLRILGTSGNDQIGGRIALNAQIYGEGGDDVLSVSSDFTHGDDTIPQVLISLFGGLGNDTLGASGEDVFVEYGDGGPGNDTYDYEDAHGDVGPFVDTGGGLDSLSVSAPFETPDPYIAVMPDGIESLDIFVGEDASLIVYGNNLNNTIEAGTNNGSVSIFGEGGNDSLFAGGPSYEEGETRILLSGGPGNDTLTSEGEDDGFDPAVPVTYEGDSGNDTADFSARSGDLTITLDNKPNDGQGHHLDNVMSDVETILGGSGNDFIQGNPSFNKLVGNAGNDTLWGGGGNDTLDGGSGHDQLHGQAGNDLLLGKDGEKDTLDGGDDFDTATRDNGPGVFDVVSSIEKFTP